MVAGVSFIYEEVMKEVNVCHVKGKEEKIV